MQELRITRGKYFSNRPDNTAQKDNNLKIVHETANLIIEADAGAVKLDSGDGRRAIMTGNIIGIRLRSGILERMSAAAAKAFIFSHTIAQCRSAFEGRYILIVMNQDGSCEITHDRYGQSDLYYMNSSDCTILANALNLMPARDCAEYDQASLAHLLTLYGYRPPKKHTIYSGIQRLGVDEVARISEASFEIKELDFIPLSTAPYGKSELMEYADTFLDAVEARGSHYGNVVYLSSGWDSSAILAALVHIYGARKVRAVIGRMNYNKRSGIINQFELDRAKEIADYFGVSLEISEFDYWTHGPEYLARARETFRSQQITSITALNHMRLAETVAARTNGNESVFVGEISDGAHNLGFSQFVTIFHPDLGFREYSDKMASYLYGPTFLEQLQKNAHESDPIYHLLLSQNSGYIFDKLDSRDASTIRKQVFESFFIRNNRIPLYSRRNARLLTERGQDLHTETMGTYLDDAARTCTPGTLYSWYLHLYNSFHWQGSTVACIHLAGDAHGLDVQMPFRDSRIMEFLSAMPENWGRGLEPRPTKYPLKWMLKHKIDYPGHLQVGPHSYRYDVDHNFNHSAELLYGSSFTSLFKELLKKRSYESVLDPSIFDMPYIRQITSNYLADKEVVGAERNDLFAMCMLEWTGDYKRENC